MEETSSKSGNVPTGMALLNEDLLQNILSKLPAPSFASAAQVSRSWNRVCSRVLSRPKFASAISLNTSLQGAVEEVIDKVLREPIRPHFGILCVGLEFNLKEAHKIIRKKLGSMTPIISSATRGVIGNDALTDEFREVKWMNTENDPNQEPHNFSENAFRGAVLIVGFLPGVKVATIPLLRTVQDPEALMVDKFVTNIRTFSSSVSGFTSPGAIVLFGDQGTDMKPILDKMNYGLSKETVIVGDECCKFLMGNGDTSILIGDKEYYTRDAVALVFARDRYKPQGVGEIHFHAMLSSGIKPVGPVHKIVSVKTRGEVSERATWITARREGSQEILDGERLLLSIQDEMINHINEDMYIGVTQKRKCGIGVEKVKQVTSLSFHTVLGGDEEYLFLEGVGIKTGDTFRFYHSDPVTAQSSLQKISEELSNLKEKWTCKSCAPTVGIDTADKKDVCGGLIFTCYGRDNSFFGQLNADSKPVKENFPGVPIAGLYCGGEIARCCSSSGSREGEEQNHVDCFVNVYSCAYLLVSCSSFA